MITPSENTEGAKTPSRVDIFDAALATYVSMNGPGRDECPDVEMEKMRARAAKIGCDPQRVFEDVEFIHKLIRNMRRQIMEGTP